MANWEEEKRDLQNMMVQALEVAASCMGTLSAKRTTYIRFRKSMAPDEGLGPARIQAWATSLGVPVTTVTEWEAAFVTEYPVYGPEYQGIVRRPAQKRAAKDVMEVVAEDTLVGRSGTAQVVKRHMEGSYALVRHCLAESTRGEGRDFRMKRNDMDNYFLMNSVGVVNGQKGTFKGKKVRYPRSGRT